MAKALLALLTFVSFLPDRGNLNPEGKSKYYGKITKVNDDGTYQVTLNNGRVVDYVSEGDGLGYLKVETKPKTKKDVPNDENDPYDEGTVTE